MNSLPSRPTSPKNRLINQLNQRTMLLPTVHKGRLTDLPQIAGQQHINLNLNIINNHHPRPTISYRPLLHQHRKVIKQANININQFRMLASVQQYRKLIQRKR